jgi:flagellar motility protein MotE (MotC chaperone)
LAPTVCAWLEQQTQNVYKEEENYCQLYQRGVVIPRRRAYLSTLLTQGEALPEPDAAHEAELAKLRKEAEELARTKKRLLAIQHEAEIQKQKAEIASLKEELRALKAKQSLSFNQPSP